MVSNVLAFIEQVSRQKPFPVQRILLKLMYGLPLDDTTKIPSRIDLDKDPVNMTEVDYVLFLHGHDRLMLPQGGKRPNRVVLVHGRRGGTTQLFLWVKLYEVYRRIREQQIGSHLLTFSYDQYSARVLHDQFWKETQDKEHCEKHSIAEFQFKYNIHCVFRTICSALDTFHGRRPSWIYLDEMAHYPEEKRNLAMNGSLPALVNKGTLIMASSPLYKEGRFYQEYQDGMTMKSGDTLVMQVPTWEMNPMIPTSEFDYLRSHLIDEEFRREYGAEFI